MQRFVEVANFEGSAAFLAVFLSWFVAQMYKVFQGVITHKKFDVRWIFHTGGMPSSHSSTVAGVATVVGLKYGFDSVIFLFALIFCLITMFDAAGVRRSVGRQAKVLNAIIDDFNEKGEVKEVRVRELLGHTPVEVFVGAFLGVVVSILICG